MKDKYVNNEINDAVSILRLQLNIKRTHMVNAETSSGLHWGARYAYVGGTVSDVEYTGGLIIRVSTSMPDYGRPTTFERRLRPGWTWNQFEKAITTLYWKAKNQTDLDGLRSKLYNRVNNITDTLTPLEHVGFIEKVNGAERDTDHPAVYSEMSEDDLVFWHQWLDKFQEEHNGNN